MERSVTSCVRLLPPSTPSRPFSPFFPALCTCRHADAGILKYASVDALLAAMLPGGVPPEGAAPTQVARPLL